MHFRPLTTLCVLIVMGLAGAGLTADGEAINGTQERLVDSLRTLASDEFEGRGVGTQGLVKAQYYLGYQFAQAGLDLVSVNGTPFQKFDVTDGAVLLSPNTLSFQGPDGTVTNLEMGQDFQVCSFGEADTFSAPLVFAGYGIESSDPEYNDFAGLDIKGKAVVVMRRTPQQGKAGGLFDTGPHGASRQAAIRTKVSHAFRHGAAAILFVNDLYNGRHEAEQIETQLAEARKALEEATLALNASGDEQTARAEAEQKVNLARQRVEQTEKVLADHKLDPLMEFGYGGPRSGKTVPILHISQEACSRLLSAALGKSLEQLESEIDETGRPQSQPLTGWTANGQTSLAVKRIDVANVIGVIEGEGPLADETIVIGAHYDHVGRGGEGSLAPNSKEIHNGADDNASGTAALIELARRYAARPEKPARRLVFIGFTGEERGLLGSAHYVNNPIFPLDKTIAMFNMDMIGRLSEGTLTVFGTGTSERWESVLDQFAKGEELQLVKKPEGFGPSDHSSFYGKQIPVLHLFTGTHDDYHRPTDDWEKINVDGMVRITNLLEKIVDDTLARPERPNYIAIEQRATVTRAGSRPYFGSIPDFSTEGKGYALQGVTPGSPAALGGLKAGDLIVALGTDQIGSLDDFDLALRKFKAGQQISVTVERGGEKVVLPVVLGTPRE